MSRRGGLNKWQWGLLILFAAGWAVMFCLMPRYVDDLWFGATLRPWIEGEVSGFPGREIWEVYRHHWAIDNVRLANIVYVPMLLLPKWMPSLAAAAAWGLAVSWLMRMLELPERNLGLFSLLLFLLSFALPWYDSISALCYQFNYVISSFLAIGAITYCLRGRNWLIAGVIGVVLGAWHEGFALPVLGGLAGAFVACPKFRYHHVAAMGLGIILGTVWLFVSPAVVSRVGSGGGIFTLSHAANMVPLHWCFILLLIVTGVAVWKEKRSWIHNPVFVILAVSAAASLLIHFFTVRAPRAGWWCELASASAVIIILKEFHVSKFFPALGVMVCLPVTFAHLVLVDVEAARIGSFYRHAINDYKQSETGVVFARFTNEHQAPLLCWNAPDFTLLLSRLSVLSEAAYQGRVEKPPIVVPDELKRHTRGQGTLLNGNIGLRNVNGHLVIEADKAIPTSYYSPDAVAGSQEAGEFVADIDYGYTVKRSAKVLYHPFISQADGCRYAYIYPWRAFVEMRLGDVKGMWVTSQ